MTPIDRLAQFVAECLPDKAESDIAIKALVDLTDRYQRNIRQKEHNHSPSGIKQAAKQIADGTEALLKILTSDPKLTSSLWYYLAAPNAVPPASQNAIEEYQIRAVQARQWNRRIGRPEETIDRLKMIADNARRVEKELTIAHRRPDLDKLGFGVELAIWFHYLTNEIPTRSGEMSLDDPKTRFGWFVRHVVETMPEHEEINRNFPRFIEAAIKISGLRRQGA